MAVAQQDRISAGSGDEERMIARLRAVRDEPQSLTVAEIEELIGRTASHRLRNAAALALVDLKAVGAAERIGALLERPDVAPQSGTLLFALEELGGWLPLQSFVTVLRYGSFEGRSEALHFLDAGRVSVPDPDARRTAIGQLAALVAGSDPEAAEAAEEAVSILLDRAVRTRSEERPA
jgi:hypothetical protein